jgi:hypothetical protein
MKIYSCLSCNNINTFDYKSISINSPKVIKCKVCQVDIQVEFISKSCCTMKYKFSVTDGNSNVIIEKYKTFPKK